MKKFIVFIVALLGISVVSSAGDNQYPIAKEGKKWVYYTVHSDGNSSTPRFYPLTYEFEGDTVIQDATYLILWEDKTLPVYDSYHFYIVDYTRERKQVAYVRDTFSQSVVLLHSVLARRAGSLKPLTGKFIQTYYNDCTYGIYWFPFVQEHFDDAKLTKAQREELFTFTGTETITLENGEQRTCWKTNDPGKKLIEGIGYVTTTLIQDGPIPANFIDFDTPNALEIRKRIFSHLIEDGQIIYKGEWYDFMQKTAFDPDNAQRGDTGMNDVPVVEAEDGDAPYYDMQGHGVAAPTQPGIYIHNGQKVVVK
ncbi:MAG: hypothetical protein J5565_00660 [Muribaculaceae bacterium]|nr:hypothetical protein [Muribaculaceae bacterium]